MQLAFALYKYFPFGGLQRDFLRIALACQARGHAIRVYVLEWRGEVPAGFEVVNIAVRGFSNARRYARFLTAMQQDLRRRPADRLIGFNKMPGLDVYFAADPCYEEKARTLRGPLYRLSGRYRHFAAFERAVFAPESSTIILMISALQQPFFEKHYGTPPERFHLLPPGISPDRRAPANAADPQPEIQRAVGSPQAVGVAHTLRTIPEACARLEGQFTGGAASPYKFAAVRTSARSLATRASGRISPACTPISTSPTTPRM